MLFFFPNSFLVWRLRYFFRISNAGDTCTRDLYKKLAQEKSCCKSLWHTCKHKIYFSVNPFIQRVTRLWVFCNARSWSLPFWGRLRLRARTPYARDSDSDSTPLVYAVFAVLRTQCNCIVIMFVVQWVRKHLPRLPSPTDSHLNSWCSAVLVLVVMHLVSRSLQSKPKVNYAI